jgi:branched-chain amino acid transport system substrate-binding protein
MATLLTSRRRLLSSGVATGAFLLASRGPARAADEIVVGATVSITGPLAAGGLPYYLSLKMAQDDINAAGGIDGRKLRIAFEDTQASNSVAVNAFIKLAQQYDPPFIFLSGYSIQNLAVEPQVAKARIPSVYAGGAVAIADHGNPWMFRIRPPDNVGAQGIAAALVDRLKAKRIGIVHVQDDYGTASASIIAGLVKAAGGEVVATEAFGARDNDFSAQLLAVKNANAQAFVAVTYVRDGALLLTQRRTLGIDIPMIGGQAYVLPSLLDLVRPADFTNVYSMVDAVLGDAVGPRSAVFVKRFSERFKMRADPFASCYYDAAMMMADAMRKVGTDRTKIRDYFAAVKDYTGVTRSFTTDKRGDMAHNVALVTFVPGTKDISLVGYYPSAA